MRYTLLKATDRGVVLWRYHVRRLEAELGHGSAAREPCFEFGRTATPGVWAIWVDDAQGFRCEPRGGSRLFDGMPSRTLPSPLTADTGEIPKPWPSTPYDPVRLKGVATLLTSPDGGEIYEACSAAVVGWDGALVVCPRERPRVWSTAEAAIREHLRVREATIPSQSEALLMVNAVKGTCALARPRSSAFPESARRSIEDLLEQLTCRA